MKRKKIYEATRKEGLGIFYISPLDEEAICNYCIREKCEMKNEYERKHIKPSFCTEFEVDREKAKIY